MVTVKFDDLSTAFDFVGFASPMEHRASCRWIPARSTESRERMIKEDECWDDLETSDGYIEIPHKNELDLGNNLALQFVESGCQTVHGRRGLFRHRGAYARFKELLAAKGGLQEWYAFEAESTVRALREWCEANGSTWPRTAVNNRTNESNQALQPTAAHASL